MRKSEHMISHEHLKQRLLYIPETGEWFWKLSYSVKVKPGDKAGGVQKDGYYQIRIDDILYQGHRLAWFYMTGEWPHEIDHKDRNRSNNIWTNLRLVTRSQNNANLGKRKDNSSGFRGVSWSERDGYFHCYINKEGKRTNIGYFQCPVEAAKAYDAKAKEIFGEFAYQNFKEEK